MLYLGLLDTLSTALNQLKYLWIHILSMCLNETSKKSPVGYNDAMNKEIDPIVVRSTQISIDKINCLNLTILNLCKSSWC